MAEMSRVSARSNVLERRSPVFLPYGVRRKALVPATGKALAEACGVVYNENHDRLSLPEYYFASQDGAKVLSKCSQGENQNHPSIVCAAIYGTCEDYERVSQEWFSDQDDVRSCLTRVHRFLFVMSQYFGQYVDWDHAIEDSGDAVFGAMAEAVKTLVLSSINIPPYKPSLSTGSYTLIGLYGNCLLKDCGNPGLRFVAENIDGSDDYFQISIVTNERQKNVLAWFRFQVQIQPPKNEMVINLIKTETHESWGGLGMSSCLFSLILHFWQCCKPGVGRVQITAASPVMLYTSAIFGFYFMDEVQIFTHFKNVVVPWLLGDADKSKKTSHERYPNIKKFVEWNKYATCWDGYVSSGPCGRMTANRETPYGGELCDNYNSYCHAMSLRNTTDMLDFELETQMRMKKMVERYCNKKKKTIVGSGPDAPQIECHLGTKALWAATGAAVTVLCSLVGSCACRSC